ncbi:hypothetical protein [Desulfocurvus sp. DL9XJH121]
MQNVVVHMDNGDVLEFVGEMVATTTREVHHDGRRRSVCEYRLYRREDGGWQLVMESYEKISARQFNLRFTSREDARDYVARGKGGEDLVRELFGGDGD